ncbi:MAG: cytochrome c biogenesis protein CcsA [Leptospirales bacterium]|nr:cytochrome c biogenesis protein CcsA [Leptospirales bacterium]
MKVDIHQRNTSARPIWRRKGAAALDWALVALAAGAAVISFVSLTYPPTLASQGQASRILFVHVPVAWVALYAPCLSALAGILYLLTRLERYDIWSLACARIAFVFSLAVVLTGGIWGSVEWGTFWSFQDPRLMSFAILVLTLGGYFMARGLSENPARTATYGAAASILAALAALLTWFAIRVVTPDLHPTPVIGTMSRKIAQTFWLAVGAYHFVFLALLRAAVRHERIARATRWLNELENTNS